MNKLDELKIEYIKGIARIPAVTHPIKNCTVDNPIYQLLTTICVALNNKYEMTNRQMWNVHPNFTTAQHTSTTNVAENIFYNFIFSNVKHIKNILVLNQPIWTEYNKRFALQYLSYICPSLKDIELTKISNENFLKENNFELSNDLALSNHLYNTDKYFLFNLKNLNLSDYEISKMCANLLTLTFDIKIYKKSNIDNSELYTILMCKNNFIQSNLLDLEIDNSLKTLFNSNTFGKYEFSTKSAKDFVSFLEKVKDLYKSFLDSNSSLFNLMKNVFLNEVYFSFSINLPSISGYRTIDVQNKNETLLIKKLYDLSEDEIYNILMVDNSFITLRKCKDYLEYNDLPFNYFKFSNVIEKLNPNSNYLKLSKVINHKLTLDVLKTKAKVGSDYISDNFYTIYNILSNSLTDEELIDIALKTRTPAVIFSVMLSLKEKHNIPLTLGRIELQAFKIQRDELKKAAKYLMELDNE